MANTWYASQLFVISYTSLHVTVNACDYLTELTILVGPSLMHDLKSTAPSESEAGNGSFIHPREDEDQRPDLDALSNAYSLLHTAPSLNNESLISTTTIRERRIRFETFTLQDFKRLHLVPSPAYLEASASPKQVKEGPQDPQHSHVKEDSGFEDDEMLKPLIQYSFPPEATWSSYKPLPVIDAQTGLLLSPSIPSEKRLALPVRRFRQPTFPGIKREELPHLSDDEDDKIVDFSAPNSRGASNNESILASVSLPQGRNQPAPMPNMGRKPIESNGNKYNVTSAGQTSSHSDGFVSSQATSLGCPPARGDQAKSHWEKFRPTRSKAASGISNVSLAKSIHPSWDYPRLVVSTLPTSLSRTRRTDFHICLIQRGERTSPDIITASPAMTTKAPPSTVSSACPDNTVVYRTCGSILSSGRQFDSTSSEGEDKVPSVSSSPSLVNEEAFPLNSNVASELDEDEPGVKGSTMVGSSTMYMNVPDETFSLAFSQVPTGDAIGHWKIPAAVKHSNAAELSTPARENPAVLPVARHNYALPTSTSPVPSDIAYGWGPEEVADSSDLQESDDKTVTTSPPATGIGWDDDEAPPQNTTRHRHALDSWDPDVAIKKVPTPGYNISSKARSPTNVGSSGPLNASIKRHANDLAI